MDTVTQSLIETIGNAGYDIQIGSEKGCHIIETVDQESGERFIIRSSDLYEGAIELAQQIGFELEE